MRPVFGPEALSCCLTAARRARTAAVVLLLFAACAPVLAEPLSWIATWTASPQAARGNMPASFSDRTVRQTVHLSVGGTRLRIQLSNEFGTRPLLIGAASVAVPRHAAEVNPSTLRPLTFGGTRSLIIPPGAVGVSDPVDLVTSPLSDLAVSLFLPGPTELTTVHQDANQTAYVSDAGDFSMQEQFPIVDRFANRFFLDRVLVETSAGTHAIVTFGDSITDGRASTVDANRRWPDVLAARFSESGRPTAVLNAGISGNRLLSDAAGANALARFGREVLSELHVSHVVVFLGINDIGWPGTPIEPSSNVRSANELIVAYKQLIEQAHLHAIKVIGGTLTPFEGSFAGTPYDAYFTPDKEAKRKAVNAWIRDSGAFDAVIDFEHVLADPQHPTMMRHDYDSGDHLHPNDAGYRAMAQSIDLRVFQ